jgi:hypothetical protein
MLPVSACENKRLGNKETTYRRNKERNTPEKYKSKWISEKYAESKRKQKQFAVPACLCSHCREVNQALPMAK